MGAFDNPSDWLFLAGIALLTIVGLRKWYRRYGRQGRRRRAREDKKAAQPAASRTHSTPLLDAPPDTLRWQVEMHDLARDLKAELDTKIVTLQSVTAAARREADRLESLLSQARQMEESKRT